MPKMGKKCQKPGFPDLPKKAFLGGVVPFWGSPRGVSGANWGSIGGHKSAISGKALSTTLVFGPPGPPLGQNWAKSGPKRGVLHGKFGKTAKKAQKGAFFPWEKRVKNRHFWAKKGGFGGSPWGPKRAILGHFGTPPLGRGI